MKSKLESRIDAEFEHIGVKPYVYHIRVLYPGRHRRLLRLFEGITIATDSPQKASEVKLTVFGLDDACALLYPEFVTAPSAWMQKELADRGFYGVAICNREDQYSRKRGRIIAKGRLLQHLKERKT